MTNDEAVGYVTMAINNILKEKSLDERQELIEKVTNEMSHLFDMKTKEEAYDIGRIIRTSDKPVYTVKSERINP